MFRRKMTSVVVTFAVCVVCGCRREALAPDKSAPSNSAVDSSRTSGSTTGRSNAVDPAEFKSAIDAYYGRKPVCIWKTSVKFPLFSHDDSFKVLRDEGLLRYRWSIADSLDLDSDSMPDPRPEKFWLSGKGQAIWTEDPSKPRFGNFCFGHLSVTTIDGFTPSQSNPGQYVVSYHASVPSLPDWASSARMKAAFTIVALASSGRETWTATLARNGMGWEVTDVSVDTNPRLSR